MRRGPATYETEKYEILAGNNNWQSFLGKNEFKMFKTVFTAITYITNIAIPRVRVFKYFIIWRKNRIWNDCKEVMRHRIKINFNYFPCERTSPYIPLEYL